MSEFVLGLSSNQIDRRVLLDVTDASNLEEAYQLSPSLNLTSFSIEAFSAGLSGFSATSFFNTSQAANVLPSDTLPIFNNMENDDFADNISTTGVLEIDGMTTGVINFIGDRDWFAIELTAGELIRITSDSFDANLILRDELGNSVAFDFRDFSTNETVILTQVAESGTYYVDVSSFESSLNYTLTASIQPDDFAGDASTIGALEVGGTATGTIEFTTDSDWFAIELTAGEAVRIASNSMNSTTLSLVNEFGFIFAFDFFDFETLETVVIAQVQQSGTYYVDVSGFESPLDYTLTATLQPDDFAGDTSTSGVLEIDGTATGAIEFNNDRDWFVIELTAGEVVRIASDSFDADLSLRDEFGTLIAFDSRDFVEDVNVIFTQVAESGTYYVDVSSFDASLDYTLTATALIDDFTDDTNTTGVLEIGGVTTGAIDFVNDSDWFAIELTVGEVVRITSDSFDANLVLRNEFGDSVASDFRDFNTNENVIIAQISESGTYYIDVTSFNFSLDYTLAATVLPDDFAGDISTTGTLEVGGATTGAIEFRDDSDWFAIELTAGQLIRIASDVFTADLILRDEFGNFVASDTSDFATDGNVIIEQISESGTYYVDVSSSNSFAEYTITATVQPDDFAGDTSTTGVLEIGGTATGTIEFDDDSDWFAIELTAGDSIRIASGSFDANLILRDEFGDFVASDIFDSSTNENVIIAQIEESGTYYVDVSSFRSSLDYTISTTVQPDDFAGDTSTTGVLEIGGTATGAIEFRDDSDWFAIELTTEELVRITSTVGGFVLRDEFGNFVASDSRDNSTNESVIIAQVEESGTYYVDVTGIVPLDYTLTATVQPDDFAGDTSTTGTLEVGGTATGAIEFDDDSDWFAIELTAGELIRIAANDSDPNLILRDEFGNVLTSGFRDVSANESILVAQVGETGTYYIDISSFNSPLDYTLTASVQPDDFAEDTSTTGVLNIGGTATGTIEYLDDSDWFSLAISDTDLGLRLLANSNRIDLSVYDINGNFVTSSVDGGTIEFSEVGTYFVEATDSFTNFVLVDYIISAVAVSAVEATSPVLSTGIVDTVVDEANETTYSLTRDGVLIRYSNNTDTVLPNTDLGIDTSALSLSQDGRHLFVAQADLENVGNNIYEATVLQIDVETLEIESFSFEVTGNGYEIIDIQAVADGSLFVTTDFPGSGSVPFYNLSGFDGTFSADILNDPAFGSSGEINQESTLDISRDGQFLLIAESNSSGYPVSIYSVAAGEVIASISHGGGLNRDRNTISGEAELVVVERTVYDFNFNQVANLSDFASRATHTHFSLNGEYLFLVNQQFNIEPSITVVSTTNFEVVSIVTIPQDISVIQELDISPDGLSIIVTDTASVHYLDLSDTAFPINGTSNADRFVGTEFDELISGFEGNDFLDGAGGDDTLLGAQGNDTLIGGAGDDTLSGGEGNDRLFSGAGDDVVEGGIGDDNILGASGNDTLFGGEGTDTIDGGANNDVIDGGSGKDMLLGGNGNDLILGGLDNDIIRGDTGNDRLEGGQGDDFLSGNAGNDLLIGGTGNDRLFGSSGQDVLFGQQGDDLLFGGGGNDRLVGASGDDTLYGQNGDDILEGGSGSDTLTGGLGADLFVVIQPSATTTITDLSDGEDMLDLSDFGDTDIQSALDGASQQGTDTVLTFSNGSVIVLENFDLNDLSDEDIAGFDMGMIA